MFSKEQLRELLTEVTSREFSVLAEKQSKAYEELLEAYKKLQEQLKHLQEENKYLLSIIYGRSSEKKSYVHIPDPLQPELDFGEPEPQEVSHLLLSKNRKPLK